MAKLLSWPLDCRGPTTDCPIAASAVRPQKPFFDAKRMSKSAVDDSVCWEFGTRNRIFCALRRGASPHAEPSDEEQKPDENRNRNVAPRGLVSIDKPAGGAID
jgi:hypothetical protein